MHEVTHLYGFHHTFTCVAVPAIMNMDVNEVACSNQLRNWAPAEQTFSTTTLQKCFRSTGYNFQPVSFILLPSPNTISSRG